MKKSNVTYSCCWNCWLSWGVPIWAIMRWIEDTGREKNSINTRFLLPVFKEMRMIRGFDDQSRTLPDKIAPDDKFELLDMNQ